MFRFNTAVNSNDPRTYELGGTGREQYLEVTVGGTQVCLVRFNANADDGRLELTQVDTTRPEHKRQGHATSALKHLAARFPDLAIINSPDYWNTDDGRALVASLRRQGVAIHDYGCYRDGYACRCELAR